MHSAQSGQRTSAPAPPPRAPVPRARLSPERAAAGGRLGGRPHDQTRGSHDVRQPRLRPQRGGNVLEGTCFCISLKWDVGASSSPCPHRFGPAGYPWSPDVHRGTEQKPKSGVKNEP